MDLRAIIQKSDISLIILDVPESNFTSNCDCYFLLQDHQLFLRTFKAGCINEGRSGMTT